MLKKGYSTTLITEMATIHTGTCTRTTRFIMITLLAGICTKIRATTYLLDLSNLIEVAIGVEERVEYHSNHREGYTQCRHMHKEYSDNLLSGVIKLNPSSNVCGRSSTVPQYKIIEIIALLAATCTRNRVVTYLLDSIHGAMNVEEIEDNGDHQDGYSPRRNMR